MKNINIQLSDDTYWKLKSLKSAYKVDKWADLIDMLLDVLQAVGKESVVNGDLNTQTKDRAVPSHATRKSPKGSGHP